MSNARAGVATGLVIAMVGCAGVAQGIVIRHDVDDSAYRAYADSQFGSVGRMLYQDGESLFWNGSGTLISDRWVLTAAHVADEAADTDWFFDTGAGTQRVRAEEVYYHPDWFGANPKTNGDLALIRLSESITDATPTALSSGPSPFGTEVSLVGFGGSGDGTTGWTGTYDLLRRAGTNMLDSEDAFGYGAEFLQMDFDSPDSGEATDLEAMLMFGDSGGAVMAMGDNGWELIGVNTWIVPFADEPTDYGMYGDLMGSTSVDFHRDWINSVIPAPSSVLVLLGAGGLVARRRRA
jgi:hypothetical protein